MYNKLAKVLQHNIYNRIYRHPLNNCKKGKPSMLAKAVKIHTPNELYCDPPPGMLVYKGRFCKHT